MHFKLPMYKAPDFSQKRFENAPCIVTEQVSITGVAPENYHATTIFPEYFKLKKGWTLATESRMDCVVVLKEDRLYVKEFRNLQIGDQVILGRTEDGSEGIFVYSDGFIEEEEIKEGFAFRTGRSRETSYSRDYDKLYELLKYERDNGYVVWVLGPAAVFDSDSRKAFTSLINHGYVDAVLGGNALATHDLEGALFKTALGQDIYTQTLMVNGHYNHIDVINKARSCGSIESFIKEYNLNDGIIHACIMNKIPFVLAGSIRDDGPLPPVYANVYEAQDEMRKHIRKATTVIGLATQLHSIAAGNMTPSFTETKEGIRPVFLYCVDVSEFAVNKLRDRGSLAVTSIVTNIQDFLVNLERNLNKK